MADKLKPCPWCGKAAMRGEFTARQVPVEGYYAYCGNRKCDVQPNAFSTQSQAEADRIWNTRAVSEYGGILNVRQNLL